MSFSNFFLPWQFSALLSHVFIQCVYLHIIIGKVLAAFAVFDSSAVSRDNEQDMPTITNYLSNDLLRIEIEINRTLSRHYLVAATRCWLH